MALRHFLGMNRPITTYAPREYAELLADAMGEGYDAEAAQEHARGPLRRLFVREDEEDEEEQ